MIGLRFNPLPSTRLFKQYSVVEICFVIGNSFERSAYLVKHTIGVGVEVKTHVKYFLLEVDFHEAYALAHGKVRDFSFDKHFVAL